MTLSLEENSPDEIHPKQQSSSEQVFLINFRWVPESCHGEEGKSSRELLEKVCVNAVPFLVFGDFEWGYWVSTLLRGKTLVYVSGSKSISLVALLCRVEIGVGRGQGCRFSLALTYFNPTISYCFMYAVPAHVHENQKRPNLTKTSYETRNQIKTTKTNTTIVHMHMCNSLRAQRKKERGCEG